MGHVHVRRSCEGCGFQRRGVAVMGPWCCEEGWADAEASYREALRLNPNYANAKNDLSKLLKKLGKEDAAP